MNKVMENIDLRKEIWSFLRKKPKPLEGSAEYYEGMPDNPKLGDIIENNTSIVYCGKNSELIVGNNQNEYLIIPLEITQYISNAIEYYDAITYENPNIIIYLRWDDKYIIDKFGELPMFWNYSFRVDEDILEVDFGEINIMEQFNVNIHTKKDIIDFYNGCKKKQSKLYFYFSYEDNVVRISFSNQLDIPAYHFYEFYIKKYNYPYHNTAIVTKWFNNVKLNEISTYLPNTWRSSFIRGVNKKNDNFFCFQFKGPLCERQTVLQLLKNKCDELGKFRI